MCYLHHRLRTQNVVALWRESMGGGCPKIEESLWREDRWSFRINDRLRAA